MFCARCGQQIPDTTVICPLCGRESTIQLQPSPATHVAAPATAMSSATLSSYCPELQGVGGWLRFFCVLMTILTPLGNLQFLTSGFSTRSAIYYLSIIVFSMIVGIQVWRVAPNALTWVKAYFITIGAWEVLRIAHVVIVEHGDFDFQMALRIRSLVWVLIWTAYFWKSKRVRATFGRNLW